MPKKFLTTICALALLLSAAPARAVCAPAGPPVAQEMTDEEGREARALALRFMKRLREADDFGPLVGEFFPKDFAERLRRAVRETPAGDDEDFLLVLDRAVLLRADAAELRRGYVALMNFWNQQDRLGDAAFDYANLECGLAGEKRPCGWGRHFRLAREALPAEAFRLAAGDPRFEPFLDSFLDEGTEGPELSTEEQAAVVESAKIRDAALLRAFIDKLERFVPLLREAVAKLRSEGRALAAAHGAAEDFESLVAAREELKVYHLDGETVGEDDRGVYSLGLPAGARLIHARVYPFEMAMTRAEGRLEILVVYPDFDGD